MTFTSSIAFRKAGGVLSSKSFARGYLDDLLVISFGVWDHSGHFVEVKVEDVLMNHNLCEDFL